MRRTEPWTICAIPVYDPGQPEIVEQVCEVLLEPAEVCHDVVVQPFVAPSWTVSDFTTRMTYDAFRQPTLVTDAAGNRSLTDHDADGRAGFKGCTERLASCAFRALRVSACEMRSHSHAGPGRAIGHL